MTRPILITVSGMVGSGKTVASNHVARLLEDEGLRAQHWRFRQLPCFTGFRRRASAVVSEAIGGSTASHDGPRWKGYRRKPLTARLTLGYLARIVAFRLYRRWHASTACHVCNRYFYDNLAHYALETRAEERYASLLRRLMPAPDVAIIVTASPATIASRRPRYSAEYLSALHESYARVRSLCPELMEVSTDPGQPALELIESIVRTRLASSLPLQC